MYNNGAKIVQRYKKESTYTNKVINKKVINNEKLAIADKKRYQQKNVHKYIAKYLAISLFFRIFKGWVGGDVLTYCDVRYDGN
tara:strand:+ start:197 stop:445 length:249 start_codon:yes stop_codon:yes gene_type:complete